MSSLHTVHAVSYLQLSRQARVTHHTGQLLRSISRPAYDRPVHLLLRIDRTTLRILHTTCVAEQQEPFRGQVTCARVSFQQDTLWRLPANGPVHGWIFQILRRRSWVSVLVCNCTANTAAKYKCRASVARLGNTPCPGGCQITAGPAEGRCRNLNNKLELPHSLIAACHISKRDPCAAVPAGLPLALRKLYGLNRVVWHLLPRPVQ